MFNRLFLRRNLIFKSFNSFFRLDPPWLNPLSSTQLRY
nr:MAG TPA: hypothetical protein [Bacteriophage sp.]